MNSIVWRFFFVVAGALIAVGGSMHPDGSMERMLADPAWLSSHVLVLAGFVVLLVGMMLIWSNEALRPDVKRWARFAMVGTVLQATELVLHTASYTDHAALVAGDPTPILTAHLVATVILQPMFAVAMAMFIVVAGRRRVVGSPWISWLGVGGVIAHGIAPVLVVGLGIDAAGILFPMVLLFAGWLVLAGVWRLSPRVLEPEQAG